MKYLKLSDICHVIKKGKAVTKNDKGNIYAIGFTNIENGKIVFDKVSKCKLTNEYEDLLLYHIELNDIIFPPITRKNLIIKQIEVLDNSNEMLYSSRGIFVRVNQNKYNAEFLYHLLSTQKYQERLLNEVYNYGSYPDTYQIAVERLENFKIPDISMEKQIEILNQEKKITTQIKALENELFSLYEEL